MAITSLIRYATEAAASFPSTMALALVIVASPTNLQDTRHAPGRPVTAGTARCDPHHRDWEPTMGGANKGWSIRSCDTPPSPSNFESLLPQLKCDRHDHLDGDRLIV